MKSSHRQQQNSYPSEERGIQPTHDSGFQDDPTYFSERIDIPLDENYSFSWRKLWIFTGPGFLMSIAFLDPGNIESDLQGGVVAKYRLLWILAASSLFGLFAQIMSARIGTVTGLHMAELCYRKFPRVPRLLIWILTELAIIGSDMQEVIGTAISIYLLSQGTLPLWAGVLVTILDTFTFLFLDKYGLRKLEAFFAVLIATMAITFGYEFFKVNPDFGDLGLGLVVPYCKDCKSGALEKGVGIIGAIIAPHNLYLHSALVKSRKIDRRKEAEIQDANRYVAIESAIAIMISLVINIMVTGVFAEGLYGRTNREVRDMCLNSSYTLPPRFDARKVFDDDDEDVSADLYKAGIYLGCAFGLPALYVWAIGLFAAGQSSTMTGTYTGQFVMEGFLDLRWRRWKRVLLTRSIAIVPCFSLAISVTSIDSLTGMNDLLNVMMSMMLPFALFPLMIFSSSEKVMKSFRSRTWSNIGLWFLSAAIIGTNIYFAYWYVDGNLPKSWYVYILVGIFATCYLSFIAYLLGCLLFVLNVTAVSRIPFLGKYMTDEYYLELPFDQLPPGQ